MNKIGFTLALMFSTCSFAALVGDCPTTNGGTALLLMEGPESQGEPATPFCSIPAGFTVPTIPFALALTENAGGVPPVISDLVLFAPTGLITFFSDPAIPTDITFDATQSEAPQNFITVAGVNYVVISDVSDTVPDVPEPSTALLIGVPLVVIGARKFRPSKVARDGRRPMA